MTVCVQRAGDFVLAAEEEPFVSIAWGDRQINSYLPRYRWWFHDVNSVGLFGVFDVSLRVPGLDLVRALCKIGTDAPR